MRTACCAECEDMFEIPAESRTQAHVRGVSLIWAQSTSGVIGPHGGIPWRLPEDQVRFKELTLGHTVGVRGQAQQSRDVPILGRNRRE